MYTARHEGLIGLACAVQVCFCSGASASARAACSIFCPTLTQCVFSLLWCFSSTVHSFTSVCFCVCFSSPLSFTGHFENTMISYRPRLRFTSRTCMGMRLPRRTHAFSNFSGCNFCYSTNTNAIIYIYTFIKTPLALNTLMSGLLRLVSIILDVQWWSLWMSALEGFHCS